MINIKPCRGCGRPLIHHRVANLDVRLEPTPLTGQQAVEYLLQGGRTLWKVDGGKVRPARPGEPEPLREHGCTAAGALSSPPPLPAPPKAAPRPAESRVAPRTPSSARPTARSSARRAATPRSEGRAMPPRSEPCDVCRKPVVLDGPEQYIAIELGATVVWAVHGTCGRQ